MNLGPPRKTITVPDVIIIVCVGALGLFGGELWTAILCGTTMAITIAAWRLLWYLGSLHELLQRSAPITSEQGEATD